MLVVLQVTLVDGRGMAVGHMHKAGEWAAPPRVGEDVQLRLASAPCRVTAVCYNDTGTRAVAMLDYRVTHPKATVMLADGWTPTREA